MKKFLLLIAIDNIASLDISDLQDGIYFVRLNIKGVLSQSKRFVILN